MGVWGPAILSNDQAEDLQSNWKFYLGEGHDPKELTDGLIGLAKEESIFEEKEEEYDFWLSLALIQWKTGRLQENVKQRALEMLSHSKIEEIEADRWTERSDYNRRLRHLSKLRITLNSEQPKPRRISKYFLRSTSLKLGDIFTIGLSSGNYVIMKVIEIEEEVEYGYDVSVPSVVLFNYTSRTKPSSTDLRGLTFVNIAGNMESEPRFRFTLWETSIRNSEPTNRIEIVENDPRIESIPGGNGGFCEWNRIDSKLEEWITTHNRLP